MGRFQVFFTVVQLVHTMAHTIMLKIRKSLFFPPFHPSSSLSFSASQFKNFVIAHSRTTVSLQIIPVHIFPRKICSVFASYIVPFTNSIRKICTRRLRCKVLENLSSISSHNFAPVAVVASKCKIGSQILAAIFAVTVKIYEYQILAAGIGFIYCFTTIRCRRSLFPRPHSNSNDSNRRSKIIRHRRNH